MERYALNGSSEAGRALCQPKGQLSTLDLIVALFIFMNIILIFIWGWGEVQASALSVELLQDYRDKALDITDILLHTPGTPSYWQDMSNVSGMLSIGLVSEFNILDERKLARFADIPHETARNLFGLSSEDYCIEIKTLEGEVLYSYGETREPSASVQRMALLNGNKVMFELRLFKK